MSHILLHMHTNINAHNSTLYCAKGNYEFGVIRIMKSLEPYSKKVLCMHLFYVHYYCMYVAGD